MSTTCNIVVYYYITILANVAYYSMLVSFATPLHCIGLWWGKGAAQKVIKQLQEKSLLPALLFSPAKVLRVAVDVQHHSCQGEQRHHLGKQMLSISEAATYALISGMWQMAH